MTAQAGWVLGIGLLLAIVLGVLAWSRGNRKLRRQRLSPRRFTSIARSVEIADPAVAACWVYVVDAVKSAAHADDLLVALGTGSGAGYDEFGVEIEGDDVAVWSELGDTLRCSRGGLETALRTLSDKAHEVEAEATAPESR